MSMLLNMIRGVSNAKYTCAECGQKSLVVSGKGRWQGCGKLNHRPLLECLDCGAGLNMGLIFNNYIHSSEMQPLIAQGKVAQHEKQAANRNESLGIILGQFALSAPPPNAIPAGVEFKKRFQGAYGVLAMKCVQVAIDLVFVEDEKKIKEITSSFGKYVEAKMPVAIATAWRKHAELFDHAIFSPNVKDLPGNLGKAFAAACGQQENSEFVDFGRIVALSALKTSKGIMQNFVSEK
jgi:hypothetical protein